jgi:Bacterial Ig-like domain
VTHGRHFLVTREQGDVEMRRSFVWTGRVTLKTTAMTALVALGGCAPPAPMGPLPPPAAGPGITFSYPRDGQLDVPLHTRVLAHFSDPLVASLDGGCVATDAGVTGAVCLVGPGGVVPTSIRLDGTTVVLESVEPFEAGATYRLYARPALLAESTNLGAEPVATFHTRAERPRGGVPPTALALNDAPLERWVDGGAPPTLVEASPLRLLFSEPLDEGSVTAETVTLLKGEARTPVPGALVAKGLHVTFDPTTDLDPGAAYVLRLGAGVTDLEGTGLAPVELPLTVTRSTPLDGSTYRQALALTPAWSGSTTPTSPLAAMPVNANVLGSQLIGFNTLGLLEGGLRAELGDPTALGGPIPLVVRRGQRLDLTPMLIRFGGVLESGLQTGTLHLVLLSDAVGFLTRNPFRPASQLPDERAPVFVDLTMDVALYSNDPQGNTLATQTVLGVRLLGLSTVDGDQLLVNQVGSLDLSTLGIARAGVSLALQLRTGATVAAQTPEVPSLRATFPAAGATDVAPDAPLELTFSAPLSPLRDGIEVVLTQGATRVPTFLSADGARLIVRPQRRLATGAVHTLTLSGLTDLLGSSVSAPAPLTFTTALEAATTVAPIVTSTSVGAPCALTGATLTSGGACVGSTGVAPYDAFHLAANFDLRVQFSQPMRASTLVVGQACNTGSVRVERLTTTGSCASVVSGTMLRSDREFRFVPTLPWEAGAAYRFTLIAGRDAACAAGEVCGANGVALNTAPTQNVTDASGGGPDLVIPFTGAPPTLDAYLPLSADPATDANLNGVVDPGEQPNEANRVAMEITGTGGVVTDASLNGDDCLPARAGKQACGFLRSALPALVGAALDHCPIDLEGKASTAAIPCVQVQVLPNLIASTSLSMNTTAIAIIPLNGLATGPMLMRLREEQGIPLGYILNEGGHPQFVINQALSVDAPNLKILGGLVSHDLKSKPLSLVLKGPVTFRADGRMDVALRNLADVPFRVNISALGLGGHIDLRIPAGEMRITLAGPLPQ